MDENIFVHLGQQEPAPTPGSPRKQECENHSTGKEHNFYFIKKDQTRIFKANECKRIPQDTTAEPASGTIELTVFLGEFFGGLGFFC